MENAQSDTSLKGLVAELFPICRSITGNGVRETLRILKRRIPIQLIEVPSGTKVFDWKVPAEWNIRDAFVMDPEGRRVVDFREHNLHLVSYSEPVEKSVTLDELSTHLHSLPNQPDLIPYRTSYYDRNWGFCLPHEKRIELKSQDYRVKVDSEFNEQGSLTYGELFLPGRSSDEVLFSSHVCHPSLANDNLASIACSVALAEFVAQEQRHYSYRFLFAPGTIGTITWLAKNPEARQRIKHGLVLALLGDPADLTYKRTRFGNATIDHVVEYVLKRDAVGNRIVNFDPFGYDERQYGSSRIALPVGRLSRSVEGGYADYHTSADNLDLVSASQLDGSLATLIQIVETLETDRIFKSRFGHCEPQLGRRGLYPIAAKVGKPLSGNSTNSNSTNSDSEDSGSEDSKTANTSSAELQKAVMWNLSLSDGETGLIEISNRSGHSVSVLEEAAGLLEDAGLLKDAALLNETTAIVSTEVGHAEVSGAELEVESEAELKSEATHGQPSEASRERSRRAHALIPGGAHTYAKGDDQFPINAPRFFERGEGCYAYDSDGNRFIEYGIGLRAVSLGHAFGPVVEAAHKQMCLGSNFTRPATIELELAEDLLGLLPAADMVKFTKNGSDATTAAIRLARAQTGRNKVLLCRDQPFFSVDDWFIGTTPMSSGIPTESHEPVIRFPYNDLLALESIVAEHRGQFACLIMEAANYADPDPGYLHAVQALCKREGILFVLDEMITGFRWNIGGAQQEYGLDPDLSTFGKAMGNGFSVAALAGKREHMELGGIDHDRPRVFLLSYTHGAEAHCLAAARATLQTYQRLPVVETLYAQGHQLKMGLTDVAKELGLESHFQVVGRCCNLIYATFDAEGQRSQEFRTLLLQELVKHGIFAPSLVVSYSHSDSAIAETISGFRKALTVYRRALEDGVEKFLVGRPSKPVFRSHN